MPSDSVIVLANFPLAARLITLTHSTKANTFLILEFEVEAILRTVANTDILHSCHSKFTQAYYKVESLPNTQALLQGTCTVVL